MMKKLTLLLLVIITAGTFSTIYSQNTQAEKALSSINRSVLHAQLGFLSSDWMEGRRAGEKGEAMASEYIASMLELYGVEPAGDKLRSVNISGDASLNERSWFQNFALIKKLPGTVQEFSIKSVEGNLVKVINLAYNSDFIVRAQSDMEIEAPVVFVGYGLKSEKLKIDEYSRTDLKGKFVLRLSASPEIAGGKLTNEELYNARRDFEEFLKKQGAAGIIDFNPLSKTFASQVRDFQNMSPNETSPRPADIYARYSIAGSISDNELTRITITYQAALEILRGTGNSIDEYVKRAGSGQQYVFQPVTGKTIKLKTDVESSIINVRNVIGMIEGKNPDQVIVIGAHYDHMGMNRGYVWNGADDNGSGTVGVMTIAKAIMETGIKPDKTIIVALWTAEEEGLLGSEYFVSNFPHKNIKLNVNFDMISRYITDDQPKKVVMTYTDTYKNFKDITASNLSRYKIDLDVDYQPSSNPPGGSDHRSFVNAGLPVMRFKPGHREEYHTPADEITTIDWDIMEKIVKISFANVWELANSEW